MEYILQNVPNYAEAYNKQNAQKMNQKIEDQKNKRSSHR
jgi:hypothetical protein